jgi:hypothetical protein
LGHRRSSQIPEVVVPVKQRPPKDRKIAFSREVLDLFRELEVVGERRIRHDPYTEKSRRLANLLGLSDAWWSMQHVNDKSDGPCHPPGVCAHNDFFRCRAVRKLLLQAAAESG